MDTSISGKRLIMVNCDTLEFRHYNMPRSLQELKYIEDDYINLASEIQYFCENNQRDPPEVVRITNYVEFEHAKTNYLTAQGFVLFYKLSNENNFGNRPWTCKVDMSLNKPGDTECKICRHRRPVNPSKRTFT